GGIAVAPVGATERIADLLHVADAAEADAAHRRTVRPAHDQEGPAGAPGVERDPVAHGRLGHRIWHAPGLFDRIPVALEQTDEMRRIRHGERTQLQARRDDRAERLANRLSHAGVVPNPFAGAMSGAHARRALSLRS